MGRSRSPLHRPVSSFFCSSPFRFFYVFGLHPFAVLYVFVFPSSLSVYGFFALLYQRSDFYLSRSCTFQLFPIYQFCTNLANTNSEVNLLMFCQTNLLILHNLHSFDLVI